MCETEFLEQERIEKKKQALANLQKKQDSYAEDEMESPGISRKSYSKFGSPSRLKEPATKMQEEIRNPGSHFSIFEHCNPVTIKSFEEWVLDEEFS